MIRGLTPAGIGRIDHIETFVTLAAKYGFGAVDYDGNSLKKWLEEKGRDHAVSFLNEHGVRIGSIGLSVEWRRSDAAFQATLASFAAEIEAAAELGCGACCTYILPSVDENPAQLLAQATKRLRTCAMLLDSYGMRLGLEFVGPHHLRRRWKHPFIDDMPSTLDWIEAIGVSNVGLLLDSFHWYTTESSVDELLALDKSVIVHVHINDAPDVPVAEVLDNDRLYPGEGVIDLKAFLTALKQIGYDGVIAQEVLRPTPPEEPAEQLIRYSAHAFDQVWPDT